MLSSVTHMEEPVEVLRQRIKDLEKDRGQLAAEAIQGGDAMEIF